MASKGSGVVLGYLKYVLGFDSLAFEEGVGDAEKRLKAAQKSLAKTGSKIADVGTKLSIGITAPLTAFAVDAVAGWKEHLAAMEQVNAAIKSMGNSAGLSGEQLSDFADKLELNSLADADDILKQSTANLLTFGNVAGEQFFKAQQAAVDLSARMGTDLQSATILVGKALNDPVKGLSALTRVGIQFTAQQKAQIKAMASAGNAAGAQNIILGELQRQYGGAAAAAANTDPWHKFVVAINQVKDAVGEQLLPLIPPFADALTSVLTAFNSLSPETQKWAIILAGAAAAAGPLLVAVGGLVSGFGSLLGYLGTSGAAAAGGTVAGGLATVTGLLGPLAIAVVAVVVAWKNWEKIGPWIDGVVQRTTAAANSINGYLASITSKADELDRRMGIPTKDELLSSLGVWIVKTWNTANQYDLMKWANEVDASIARAFLSAVQSAQRLYTGIKTWLQDRLGPVFQWVEDKAQAAGDAFFRLYDRVVGHSYVPDMVNEIGQHMARLQQTLVAPAQQAADKAAEAFRDLAQKVQPILDRLFPQQARETQFLTELDQLTKYADKAKLSAEATAEAIRRLRDEYAKQTGAPAPGATGDDVVRENPGSITKDSDVMTQIQDFGQVLQDRYRNVTVANDNLVRSFAETFRDVAGSIRNFVSDIKSGDWLSALESVLDIVGRVAGALKGGGATTWNPSMSFGGFRANGGPVSPGRTYVVGENGPEFLTTSRAGYITPGGANDNGGRRGPISFDLRGAVMTPDLLVQMQQIANQTSGQAIADFGTAQARAGRRRLGR